jgi:hypothetical protein
MGIESFTGAENIVDYIYIYIYIYKKQKTTANLLQAKSTLILILRVHIVYLRV